MVLDPCSGRCGFPAEIVDDPVLYLVLATTESNSNAEELHLLHLLYVVLTHAKCQVFLLAGGGPPSPFLLELIGGGYDVAIFG